MKVVLEILAIPIVAVLLTHASQLAEALRVFFTGRD